jgi:hypothetical protein
MYLAGSFLARASLFVFFEGKDNMSQRELLLSRADGQRFIARFMDNTLYIAIENQIIGQSMMLDVHEAHQLLTLLRDCYSYADPNKELAALYREVQALRKWKEAVQALLNRAPY